MSIPSPPRSDPEPMLTPDIAGDMDLLGEAVDRFVLGDQTASERSSSITSLQDDLRQSVDSETWRLVLYIDESVTERWGDLAVEIARWAFEAGRRFPLEVAS